MAVLATNHITKRFPGVVAVDDVSLAIEPGEVLAVVGENGAGKSTLMNLLYGLYAPDEGEVLHRGRAVRLRSPADAIALGIGMVHQHFMLVPPLTVAENVALGNEPRRAGILFDRDAAIERVARVARENGLAIDPEVPVLQTGVGMQQKVEIVRALSRGVDTLILDEPTAVLTPKEAHELFRVVRAMAAGGKTVVFISHKLREVIEVADRVAVMREGRLVAVLSTKDTNEHELASRMIGRDLAPPPALRGTPRPSVLLEAAGVCARNDRGVQALADVSFALLSGEILGVAGVEGNGQTELAEVVTGLRAPTAGMVRVGGVWIAHPTPRRMREHGVRHIPEDRHLRGLVMPFSVAENFSLGESRSRRQAKEAVETFDVRPRRIDVPVRMLSGGNQQKLIIAREVTSDARVLVAVQPTRGLDVGAIEFVQRKLLEQRDAGRAVLLVSLDLDEVLALSDRVLVLYEGRVMGIVRRAEASEEVLGRLMLGASA